MGVLISLDLGVFACRPLWGVEQFEIRHYFQNMNSQLGLDSIFFWLRVLVNVTGLGTQTIVLFRIQALKILDSGSGSRLWNFLIMDPDPGFETSWFWIWFQALKLLDSGSGSRLWNFLSLDLDPGFEALDPDPGLKTSWFWIRI